MESGGYYVPTEEEQEFIDSGDCCDNPNIESSTYADWCTNCGWSFGY